MLGTRKSILTSAAPRSTTQTMTSWSV